MMSSIDMISMSVLILLKGTAYYAEKTFNFEIS